MHAAPFLWLKVSAGLICSRDGGGSSALFSPRGVRLKGIAKRQEGDCSSWLLHTGGWLDPSHHLHSGCSESPLEVPTYL